MYNKGICVEGIYKRYGEKQILNNVSLEIKKGEIFGLLGPSGCGKTTCVKIIAGLLKQNSGKVFIMEKPMPDINLMSDIGYMSQGNAIYPILTGYQNLKFFGRLYGLKGKKLEKSIADVATLMELQDEMELKAGKYSGGMKQRLSLGIALIANPKILILDEPTVGIDPMLRKKIWEELYKLSDAGTTIMVTTHIMGEAEKCNRLAMMRKGEIIAVGTPGEIRKKSGKDTLEEAFIYFGTMEETI